MPTVRRASVSATSEIPQLFNALNARQASAHARQPHDFRMESCALDRPILAQTECIGECRIGAPAPTSQRSRCSVCDMTSVPQEFVTVDMRGLKAALLARSRADRVSVSSLVRAFVASGLGQAHHKEDTCVPVAAGSAGRTRLSVRMSGEEVRQFVAAAKAAGMSPAAYLAELMQGGREVTPGAIRLEQLSALVASNGELAVLARNIRHLANLLRGGSTQAAQEYRETLATLEQNVRGHLKLAAQHLADLRGSRRQYVAQRRSDQDEQSQRR